MLYGHEQPDFRKVVSFRNGDERACGARSFPRLLWLWPVRNHITFPVIILFSSCSDSDYCSVVLSAGRTFGSRLPGGIRSSGPTPTGSCWRTCQSPPNPLARFRAVATVRCVKTRACSDRSGRAASVAPWPALGIPAKDRRDVGQRRFANRASRRCGGSLPVVLSGAIHLFKPLSPGQRQPQPSPPVQVKCTSRKTFAQKQAKLLRSAPDSRFRPWQ